MPMKLVSDKLELTGKAEQSVSDGVSLQTDVHTQVC